MTTPKLYDLDSKDHRCWSPHAWKVRLALNYKGIEYTTEFLECQNVGSTIKALEVQPHTAGLSFTIPTMQFPDGTYVMDSRKIADKIEQVWPDKPSLHLDSPVLEKVEAMERGLWNPLLAVLIPLAPKLLNEEALPYFHETRSKFFGMPLDQFEKEHGGDRAWTAAEKPWKEMAALLRAEGGPYFLGKTVSYADFYVIAILEFGRRLDGDIFDRMLAIDPAYGELYNAMKPLLVRDD